MNRYYYKGGNPIISLIILAIIVIFCLYIIDLIVPGLGGPALITTLLKLLVYAYGLFGVINILTGV